MSPVKYRIRSLKNHLSGEEQQVKYYPIICNREKIGLRQIAADISKQSSFTTSDIVGVLEALIDNIPHYLSGNKIVDLGDLGSFSLHARTNSTTEKEKADAKLVKEVKVAFNSSKVLKRKLTDIKFVKI